MNQKKINELKTSVTGKVFKSEDSQFLLATGMKFAGAFIFVSLLVGFYLIQVVRLNYSFFKANGFAGVEALDQAYYEFVFAGFIDNLSIYFMSVVVIFFLGIYVGKILLRPFQNIGSYCKEVIDNVDADYVVDQFSDYRLLTRFSEFFFDYLKDARKREELFSKSVPSQYTGIHKPIIDKQFLFHFSFIIAIICIANLVVVHTSSVDIYEGMVSLATNALKTKGNTLSEFFSAQHFVIDELFYFTLVMTVAIYAFLAIHLYMKVSGAAFGIFATMRSFMKGNYFARVHLVGYAHVRDQTRLLNKYLDYIQDKLKRT